MKKDELRKIAQILRNKIYNENIKFYEQLAYEGKEYDGHVLTENMTILDIEKALTYREDLNKINGLDMQKYINIDLNVFLKRVVMIREYAIQSYAEVIENNPIDLSIFWLEPIMECFIEKESMYLKKSFVQKVYSCDDISAIDDSVSIEDINKMDDMMLNHLFFKIYRDIKSKLEEENCEKSV